MPVLYNGWTTQTEEVVNMLLLGCANMPRLLLSWSINACGCGKREQ